MRENQRGDERSYKEGRKNLWRRQIANEILRRTNGREKDEMVLYFAGPEDNDRAIFIEKGVPKNNLLAIDRNDANVEVVRHSKGLSVKGEAEAVLRAWPNDWPVCAVLLDYCSGLEPAVVRSLFAFLAPSFRSVVVAINLQRGRDGSTTQARQLMAQVAGLDQNDRHRGRVCLRLFATIIASHGWQAGHSLNDTRRFVTQFEQDLRPKYLSYRSGTLVFDTAVFDWPVYSRLDLEEMRRSRVRPVEPVVARRLAAMRAVRTMRRRGMLPC